MESRTRTKNAGETQIGLVALSTDLTIEQDFHRVFHDLPVKIHTNRIHFDNPITKNNLIKMEGNILDCIGDLVPDQKLNAVCFGCTSGTVAITPEVVEREVQYGRPWCPVIDPVTSVTKILQTLKTKDISIFTPYTKKTHKSIVNFFTNNNLNVIDDACMGISSDIKVANLDQEYLFKSILNFKTKADVVFLSCTALPVLPLLHKLEKITGKTYVSSTQALIWQVIKTTGIKTKIKGYGSILSK